MSARKADQSAHEVFVEYMEFIVAHPEYAGMPDVRNEDGSVQWEAPSNRMSGRHKDTHQRRRAWWQGKARSVGIDPSSDEWISRTAKQIHPTKEKPCKRCGRVMTIRYAYPNGHLLRRLRKLGFIPVEDLPIPIEPITEVVARLGAKYNDVFLTAVPALFANKSVPVPPGFKSVEALVDWLSSTLIPAEPAILSPGAMSNAPDRLDGFHSFNLCCRSKADTGRHADNLRSYTTDRRVFEYWVDGDWVAADRMMGLVRTALAEYPCVNGEPGPCSADHIGPISLGFAHRPEFQLLCPGCNSSKNNRMSLADVRHLRSVEATGEDVVSWHSQRIWQKCKDRVVDDETALRLSKLMRDNRHTYMALLRRVVDVGRPSFLLGYLSLEWADFDDSFDGLLVREGKTAYSKMTRRPRETRYASEQKARRIRVAFESARDYWVKGNRNAFDVSDEETLLLVDAAAETLLAYDGPWREVDAVLELALSGEASAGVDTSLRELVTGLPDEEPFEYGEARRLLQLAMDHVGDCLAGMWDDERYVRATVADLDQEV